MVVVIEPPQNKQSVACLYLGLHRVSKLVPTWHTLTKVQNFRPGHVPLKCASPNLCRRVLDPADQLCLGW